MENIAPVEQVAGDPIKDQLAQLQYDPKSKAILRSKGMNVSKLESNLSLAIDKAVKANDASLAQPEALNWALNMDKALGREYYVNKVDSLFSQNIDVNDSQPGNVSQFVDVVPAKGPEFKDLGVLFNKFTDGLLIEFPKSIAQLAVGAVANIASDDYLIAKAEEFTKLSNKWAEGAKDKYEEQYNGNFINVNLDAPSGEKFHIGNYKQFIGTMGDMIGFMAPAITGIGSAKYIAATGDALALAKAVNFTKYLSFGAETSMTYSSVMEEALNQGIGFQDASKVAFPVALATAGISTIGTNQLIKTFGLSGKTAKAVSREITGEVMAKELADLAGKSLSATDFVSAAMRVIPKSASKLSSSAMKEFALTKLASVGRASGAELFEEFTQSGVDLLSKAAYNKLAETESGSTGRFKDLTFKQGLSQALTEGITGGLFGFGYGWAGKNTKMDQTIFGSIQSSISKTKNILGENYSPDQVEFDADKQIGKLFAENKISETQYNGLKTKFDLMKKVAFDFQDSGASTGQQALMYQVADARFNLGKKEQVLNQAAEFLSSIDQNEEISVERKSFEKSKALSLLGPEINGSYENIIKLEEEKNSLDEAIKGITAEKTDNLRLAQFDNHLKKHGNQGLDFNPEVVVNYKGKDYLVDSDTHHQPLIREFSRTKVEDSSINNVFGISNYTPSRYDSVSGENIVDKKIAKEILDYTDKGNGIAVDENTDIILSAKNDIVIAKENAKQKIADIVAQNLGLNETEKAKTEIVDEFRKQHNAISEYIKQVDPQYKHIDSFDKISSDLGVEKPEFSGDYQNEINTLNDVYVARVGVAKQKFAERINGAPADVVDLQTKAHEAELQDIQEQYKGEHDLLNKSFNVKGKAKLPAVNLLKESELRASVPVIDNTVAESDMATPFDGEADMIVAPEEIQIQEPIPQEAENDNLAKNSIDERVIYNGEFGILRQDEGGKITFESDNKIIEFNGDEVIEKFVPDEISFSDNTVLINGNPYEYISSNTNKEGDVVSVTIRKDNGKKITIMESDTVEAIEYARLSNELDSVTLTDEQKAQASAIIDNEAKTYTAGIASVLLESYPEVLDPLMDSIRGVETGVDSSELENMAIMAAEWVDNTRKKVEQVNADPKEKVKVLKALSNFDKKINIHYEKLRKQGLGKATKATSPKQNKGIATNNSNNEKIKANEAIQPNNTNEFDQEADLRLQQSVQDLAEQQQQLIAQTAELEQQSPTVELVDRNEAEVQQFAESFDAATQQVGTDVAQQSVDKNTDTDGNSQNQKEVKPEEEAQLLEALSNKFKASFPNIPFNLMDNASFQDRINSLYPANSNKGVYAYIDPNSGELFIDKSNINPEILMHEMGHLWSFYAKNNLPKVYEKGISLVAGTVYEARARANNPNLSGESLANEALANAIQDEGISFVNKTRQATFKEWISSLFDKVGAYLGFNSTGIGKKGEAGRVEIKDMTLEQFAQAAVSDIFSKKISIESKKIAEIASQIGFTSPITYKKAKAFLPSDLVTLRDQMLAAEIATSSSIFDAKTLYVSPSDLAIFNEKLRFETGQILVKHSAKGVPEFKADYDVHKNDPSGYFWMHSEDGINGVSIYRIHNSETLDSVLGTVLGTIKNLPGYIKGKFAGTSIGNTIIPWLDRLTPDSVFDLIRDKEGFATTFLDNAKNMGIMRKHTFLLNINPIIGQVTDVMTDLDTSKVNDFEHAPKATVRVYTKDGANMEDISIPKDWILSIIKTHDTQMQSFGKSALVSEDGMRRQNQTGPEDLRKPYGFVIESDPEHPNKSQRFEILTDEAGVQQMRDIVESDEALTKVSDFIDEIFNNAENLTMMNEVMATSRPNKAYHAIEEKYYPLISYFTGNQKQEVTSGGKLIEEDRITNDRGTSPADAYIVRPVLTTINNHTIAEGFILENAVLSQNLAKINTSLAEAYKKPEFAEIGGKMNQLYHEAQGTNKVGVDDEIKGIEKFNRFLNTRFVVSAFALNLGTSIKQLYTPIASIDVRDENGNRLLDFSSVAQSMGTLFKFGIFYNYSRNLTVLANNQYGGTMKAVIDEMIEYKTLQPVIGRLLGDSVNGMFGLSSMSASKSGDIKARIINNIKAGDDKYKNIVMSFMKRSDSASLIAIFEASKIQAAKNGLTPGSVEFKREVGRIANTVVLKVNQTSDTMESSSLNKNKNILFRALTMFSGQQQKQYNLVVQSAIRSAKDPGNSDLKAAYFKTLGNSIVLSGIFMATASMVAKSFYSVLAGDDEEDTSKVAKKFGADLFSSIIGTVPGVGSLAMDATVRGLMSSFSNDITIGVPQSFITVADVVKVGIESGKIMMDEEKDINNKYLYDFVEMTDRLTGLPNRVMHSARKKFFKIPDKRRNSDDGDVIDTTIDTTIDVSQ